MRLYKKIYLLFTLALSSLGADAQEPELILPAANSNQLVAVTISPNEKLVASADLDGKIKIWESSSGKLLKTLLRGSIYNLAFTNDEKKLVITSFSQPEIYHIETGKSQFLGKQVYCEGLAISPDGQWIAIGAESVVSIWNAKTLQLKDTVASLSSNSEVQFNKDSKTLVLFGSATMELYSIDK